MHSNTLSYVQQFLYRFCSSSSLWAAVVWAWHWLWHILASTSDVAQLGVSPAKVKRSIPNKSITAKSELWSSFFLFWARTQATQLVFWSI